LFGGVPEGESSDANPRDELRGEVEVLSDEDVMVLLALARRLGSER
jgi:hypothetical protein